MSGFQRSQLSKLQGFISSELNTAPPTSNVTMLRGIDAKFSQKNSAGLTWPTWPSRHVEAVGSGYAVYVHLHIHGIRGSPPIAQQTPSNKQANRAISYRRTCPLPFYNALAAQGSRPNTVRMALPHDEILPTWATGWELSALRFPGFRVWGEQRNIPSFGSPWSPGPDPQAKVPEMLQHEAKPNSSIPESLP